MSAAPTGSRRRIMPYRDHLGPPVCRCGHGINHYMVSAEPEYSFSGYVQLAFGISARPTKVRYRCRRCDFVLGSSTDPTVLDKHK